VRRAVMPGGSSTLPRSRTVRECRSAILPSANLATAMAPNRLTEPSGSSTSIQSTTTMFVLADPIRHVFNVCRQCPRIEVPHRFQAFHPEAKDFPLEIASDSRHRCLDVLSVLPIQDGEERERRVIPLQPSPASGLDARIEGSTDGSLV
jgi:hypothetical protein